jgi:ABC-2 type transport system permease protein
MYPVSVLPEALKIATKLNPFTYGIDALKHSIFGDAGVFDFSIFTDLGVLIITSIVFVVIAGILFERKK